MNMQIIIYDMNRFLMKLLLMCVFINSMVFYNYDVGDGLSKVSLFLNKKWMNSIPLYPFPIRYATYQFHPSARPTITSVAVEELPKMSRKSAGPVVTKLLEKTSNIDYLQDIQFAFSAPSPNNSRLSLTEAVLRYQVNNTVILMLTDSGYIHQFWNSYLVSRLDRYPNLVVACLDLQVYEILSKRNVQVAFVNTSEDSNEVSKDFSEYGSTLFKQKQQWKLNIILATLQCSVNVLYMDSDIVLLRNPFPFFNTYQGLDFVAQKDIDVCTGFLFLWPTQFSKQMIDVARRIRSSMNMDDQGAILTVLETMKMIRYELLPSKHFMSGEVFFSEYQYYWDPISPDVYMYHNNWVRGKMFKDFKSKEMHAYTLNLKEEYSSTSLRYFTFLAVHSNKTQHRGTDEHVKQVISEAIKVANALNRSLIIPPIKCNRAGIPFCNLCFFDFTFCFSKILTNTRYPFKESTFVSNPNIPEQVRSSYQQGVVFDFRGDCQNRQEVFAFPLLKDFNNQVICLPCNKTIGDCIVDQLKSNQDPVLKVYSIL